MIIREIKGCDEINAIIWKRHKVLGLTLNLQEELQSNNKEYVMELFRRSLNVIQYHTIDARQFIDHDFIDAFPVLRLDFKKSLLGVFERLGQQTVVFDHPVILMLLKFYRVDMS